MTKNLKIYLAAAGIAMGMEASNLLVFAKSGLVPFNDNKYEGHKVTITDNSNEKTATFYTTKDFDGDAVVIKSPYEERINGKYECEVLFCNPKRIPQSDIDLIKQYSDNQEELLKEDSIQSLIIDTTSLSEKVVDCEYLTTEELPENNDYDVNYVTFDQDYSSKKMVNSSDMDRKVNTLYLFTASLLAVVPMGIAYSINKRDKKLELKK